MTTTTEYTPHPDPLVEIERLKLAVRVERERRVMAALWGSLDDDCPSAFALYRRSEDTPPGEREGVLAHGVMWPDDSITVRWTHTITGTDDPPQTTIMRQFENLSDLRGRLAEGVTLVWLSEDIEDLRDEIRSGVDAEVVRRARSTEVRDAVADAMHQAEPNTLTWPQCLNLADAAVTTMFGRDGS